MLSQDWRRNMTRGTLSATFGSLLLLFTACGSDREVEIEVSEAETIAISELDSVVVDEADGPARTAAENPFEFAWDLQLTYPAHTTWMSPELRDILFVQLTSGEIQAINVFSGVTLWVTRPLPKLLELPAYVHRIEYQDGTTGETIEDVRLFVISGDELFSFDCGYGQLIWRYHVGNAGPYGFQASSGPMAHGTLGNMRVFAGDWEGRLQAIAYNEEYQRPYGVWQWNLQAVPSAQPTGHEGLVYVGDQAGQFSCFGLDRDLLWQYKTQGPIRGSALVKGFSVFFGSDDNLLHALDRRSGELRGQLYLGAPIRSRPMAFRGDRSRVYVFTSGDTGQAGLRAIDTSEDNVELEDFNSTDAGYTKRLAVTRMGEAWFKPGLTRIVGSSPNRLYATRPDSSVVLAVDRKSGDIDWHWDVNDEIDGDVAHIASYVDPTDVVRAIVTVDEEGLMTTFRLFGAEAR